MSLHRFQLLETERLRSRAIHAELLASKGIYEKLYRLQYWERGAYAPFI